MHDRKIGYNNNLKGWRYTMRRTNHLTLCFSILLFFFLIGCNEPIDTGNFDSQAWKNDRNGCKADRIEIYEDLAAIKENLIGLNEMEIQDLLGKPDRKEISKRSQRFYKYYLEPGPECGEVPGTAATFEIRFGALGYANELVYNNN